MRTKSILLLPLLFLSAPKILGQSVNSGAAAAPTNFSRSFDLLDETEDLTKSPGTSYRDSGGPASYSSLSIRGSRPKDITVNLEGIPLNSSSNGEFDLGLLSPFGLSGGRLMRGGYSLLSTSPNGQLLLQLPREEKISTTLGLGDFGSFFLGQQIPHATFSFDQSENDFPYERLGVSSHRENNAHRRLNLRTWVRKSSWQAWAQLLYVDIELPGSVDFPSTPSRSKTLRPTSALQWHDGPFSVDARFDFQNQALKSEPSNQWYSGGMKVSYRRQLIDRLVIEPAVEESFDKIDSGNFNSPLRSTTAANLGLLWNPFDGHLIHPYVRAEIVSDLDQSFSIHPGMGGRHEALRDLSILWNVAFIERAPTFSELYFKIPTFYLPNPDLKRERSLQGDLGFEWQGPEGLRWQQALYVNRKSDLIESVDTGAGLYQAQNVGTSLTWGLETDLSVPMTNSFQIDGQYTFQWSRVGDEFDREALYQPMHRASVEPVLFPHGSVSLSLPLSMRSSVLASTSGDRVKEQYDLGLTIKAEPVPRIFPFEFRLRARNLLGWDREETRGYPLSNRPSVQASLSHHF